MDTDLAVRWAEGVAPLAADSGVAAATRDELAARYGETHRHFHTLAHIRQVLDTVDELAAAGEPHADLPAVRWAAWYHDAVYEPGARDNEAASAELADRALADLGMAAHRRGHVAELILATADHVARSPDAKLLVDADLAILAAPPGTYRRYVEQIRAEYRMLSDQEWHEGRGAFLDGMLARPSVFLTLTQRDRVEAAARRNLADERAALAGR